MYTTATKRSYTAFAVAGATPAMATDAGLSPLGQMDVSRQSSSNSKKELTNINLTILRADVAT